MKMKKIDYDEENEKIFNIGNIRIILPISGKMSDLYDASFNFLELWISNKYEYIKDKFELEEFKEIVFDFVKESVEEAFNKATDFKIYKGEDLWN